MTFFDYIAGIAMGTLAASLAMEFTNSAGPYFLALTLWALYALSLGIISLKSRKARSIIEGEPTILIHNGHVMEENMKQIRFNIDDLIMGLRQKNIYNISDVEFALLETDGEVSVLPKSQKRPVTPDDLHLKTNYEGLNTEMIVDGKVVEQNLQQVGLDLQWLKDQLNAQNVHSVSDVVYAELSSDGTLYIDKKSDTFPTYNQPADPEPKS
jgi:uncharacterized membrane protein YcaP (DUF421 family)